MLNLGHTFGHAIETFVNYNNWLHGEAIAAGMILATEFSVELGWLEKESIPRIQKLLERAGLPTHPPDTMRSNDFSRLMARDKKVTDSVLRLVLLKSIGQAEVCADFDRQLLQEFLVRKFDK